MFELNLGMKTKYLTVVFASITLMMTGCDIMEPKRNQPNIVLIYADDLGYGDVGCYNPDSKIKTPNIDRLSQEGVLFTDAHSPDGICSPSRYGILTGRYSWRTAIKSGNPAPGAQPWINEGRTTIASMLRDQGYNTAVIGKWGLGSDWSAAAKEGRKGLDISPASIDYSKPIYSGKPFGFEYEEVHLWYGKAMYQRKYPCHDVPGSKETKDGGRWYFKNGLSQGGDPKFDEFDMEEAQMHYIRRSVEYINAAGKNQNIKEFSLKANQPFFLYYAPHIPHYPHVPAPQFQGTSEVGLYGDFVQELDWAVGQILDALSRNNILDETIIVFTSDNGPESQVFDYINQYGHRSMKDFRGVKRDLYQGGHTVPFIISYPGHFSRGIVTDRLVSQTDIIATVADYLGVRLGNDEAEDAYSFLDELVKERKVRAQREVAIHHSAWGKLALRKGDWVFIDSENGRDNDEPEWYRQEIGVVAHDAKEELFNLKQDPQQTENKLEEYPEKAAEMRSLLDQFVEEGRTNIR